MSLQEVTISKEQVKQSGTTMKSFPISCIGSSAGGIEALTDFLGNLDENTGVAYVVIQHLDPNIESQLTSILSKLTQVPVIEAEHEQHIKPDNIYVIPSDKSPTIKNGILIFNEKTVDSRQMTIDPFMRSLAEDQGPRAIGIILSGVGSDGAMGMREITECGGITFAQDLKSAKYDGMPKSAITTACVDFVLKPSDIPHKLVEIINHPYISKISDCKDEDSNSQDNIVEDEEKITSIFSLLHEYSGINFAHYKRATVRRRILRRLAVNKLDSLESYAKYAEKHKPEIEELYQDLLIGVTSFFREPATYEIFIKKIFPEVFANRMGEEPIRIWVPGCSSGEEVYSILICLIEYMKEKNIYAPIQAFATDVNDSALDKARKGFYVGNISIDVSAERLKQFFLSIGSRYQIKKSLRNLCIFAKHDVMNDPPFPRIDLISCRNMLIYINPELQEKVISNFHYALKPKAILVLGVSETVGNVPELFETLDKKYKIYSRSNTFRHLDVNLGAGAKGVLPNSQLKDKMILPKWQSQCDQILLNKYSPPAVVVDDNFDILQFRGQDNSFLCIPEGKASLNLTKMTKEVLSLEIRKIMQEVKKNLQIVKKDGIVVKSNNETKILNLEVIPLVVAPQIANHFLITFFDATQLFTQTKSTQSNQEMESNAKSNMPSLDVDHEKLYREADLLKKSLRSTIENYEFVNKELKTANDEMLFTNEELKVINEEFETAKEELQSANEELTTVNEELQERISELNVTNENFSSLFGSINIPIVVLDSDLCITHMTASAAGLLNISTNDVGRYINTLKLNIDLTNIHELIDKVLGGKKVTQYEIKDQKSNTYLMGMSPYRKSSKRIEGVIIDFQLIGQTDKVKE
jgi:two-component system CheB/CheR fusion protein